MSGVSSMMTSTPVAVSKARMFRPSRPMMRPFISSLGSGTAATVLSAVCSAASRWIAIAMIRRASRSALFFACSLMSRTRAGGLAPGLVLHPLQDLAPRILGGEAGDPLQLGLLLQRQLVGLQLPGVEASSFPLSDSSRLSSPRSRAFDLLDLPVLPARALLGPALRPLPLLAPALDLAVQVLAQLERLHLGREHDLGLGGLRFPRGVGQATLRLAPRLDRRPSASAPGGREHAVADAPLSPA